MEFIQNNWNWQAVSNPFALFAYCFALIAWTLIARRTHRFRLLMRDLEKIPEADRKVVITREFGNNLPETISAKEWLNAQRQKYIYQGYIFSILVLLILIFIVVTGFVLLKDPTAKIRSSIQPAKEGETLILVGSFEDKSGNNDLKLEIMRQAYEELNKLKATSNLQNIRIERIPEPLIAGHEQAQEIGRHYKAKLVLWGWRDSGVAYIHGTLTDEDQSLILEGEKITLINPTIIPLCLNDALAQSSYLSFFMLGQALIDWNNPQRIELARSFVDAAITEIDQLPRDNQCSKFNPWNAYRLQADIYINKTTRMTYDIVDDNAITWTEKAIGAYNKSISLKDNEVSNFRNKSAAQHLLALVMAGFGQHDEAIKMYNNSITTADAALKIQPNDAITLFNRTISRGAISDLFMEMGQSKEAITMCQEYIVATTASPNTQSNDINMLYSTAFFQRKLGYYYSKVGQVDEARRMFSDSIATANIALSIDRNHTDTLNNKALALAMYGDLLRVIGQYTDAGKMLSDSIVTTDMVLSIDPNPTHYPDTLGNKALALELLGDIIADSGQIQHAIKMYHESIAANEAVLKIIPYHRHSLPNQVRVQRHLAELLLETKQNEAAIEMFRNSITTADIALNVQFDNVKVLANKAISAGELGSLLAEVGQDGTAIEMLRNSIMTADKALQINPNQQALLDKKAQFQEQLGNLLAKDNE